MSLETDIQELTAAVRALTATLLGQAAPTAQPTSDTKPMRAAKAKDEPAPELESEPESVIDAAEPAAPSTAPAAATEIPYAEVAKAINERCARGLNKGVKAVLLQFGANNGKELKEAQYAAFLEALAAEVE